MLATPTDAREDLRALLHKRVRSAKGSFYLAITLFLSAFLAMTFSALESLHLNTPAAAILGFLLGSYFFLTGALWASLWALIVQCHMLLNDLSRWAVTLLNSALALLRQRFVNGVLIDFAIVETQVGQLVTAQTEQWATEENLWVPAVRQWVPPLAGTGLKVIAMRVAGRALGEDETITIADVERAFAHITPVVTRQTIGRGLWAVTGLWLVFGALLLGLPFALVWAGAKLVAAL